MSNVGGVKSHLHAKGFKWVFRQGRRRVMAFQTQMSPLELIEILLWLKSRGIQVDPSSTLPIKKWLYLDKPNSYNTKSIKTGITIPFDELSSWLETNDYTRMKHIEQPGDFDVQGDTFMVWTKEEDELIRIIFDGDIVESIAKVDAESYKAVFESEYILCGLRETEEIHSIGLSFSSPVKLTLVKKERSRKYPSNRVSQIAHSLCKLDETHPLFNMIKWNTPQ